MAAAAIAGSYQIGQSLAQASLTEEGYSDRQIGWVALASMAGANSKLYKLVKSKVDERDDSTVDLYRAVEENEYFDIISCECFKPSNSGEPKRFWVNNMSSAYNYGNRLLGNPDNWA